MVWKHLEFNSLVYASKKVLLECFVPEDNRKINNKNDNPNKLIIAKNQNDWSNRHELFKNFLIFPFISKPSTEYKII